MDRKGRVLVDSRPSFNVVVTPEDVDDVTGLSQKLARLLHLTPDDIAEKIEQPDAPPFQPIPVKKDISWGELSALKAHRLDLPGVEIQIAPIRVYPYGTFAAHVLGYGGEINKEELKERAEYQMGDWIGKYGVELTWEKQLQGTRRRQAGGGRCRGERGEGPQGGSTGAGAQSLLDDRPGTAAVRGGAPGQTVRGHYRDGPLDR